MPVDSGSSNRNPIHDVTGPLGWSLAQMAAAAKCSVGSVQNDLRAKGGMTIAFPDRPAKRDGIFAATFARYASEGFPSDAALVVAEEILDIPRFKAVGEGM